jgi:hypothetical protein
MKRALPLSVIACIAFFGPAGASDVTATVHEWMGKWPALPFNQQPSADGRTSFSQPQANGSAEKRTFWQFPGTRTALEQAVGKPRATLLIGEWHTGGRLEMVDARWASFSACKPHDCADHHAFIFVDTMNGRFNACWTEEPPKGQVQNYWLAPGQKRVPLATNGCNGSDLAGLVAKYAH